MPWCLCCAALSLPWPARCRTRSTFELRRTVSTLGAKRSEFIQAYEVWQVYGHFIEEKRPRFGPGVSERMQIASKSQQSGG